MKIKFGSIFTNVLVYIIAFFVAGPTGVVISVTISTNQKKISTLETTNFWPKMEKRVAKIYSRMLTL